MVENYHEYFKLKQELYSEKMEPEEEKNEESNSVSATNEENEGKEMQPPRPKCRGLVHVVKEGDTLYKIAQMNHLRVLDLLLANPYVNVYNLQIGDEICVPVKGIPVVDNRVPYVIKEGDTVDEILKTHGLTWEELVRYNPFLLELPLPANTVLFLPTLKSR